MFLMSFFHLPFTLSLFPFPFSILFFRRYTRLPVISLTVVAGYITLMNSARVANGLPLLGFVNPLLYSVNYASNFYDITSGL